MKPLRLVAAFAAAGFIGALSVAAAAAPAVAAASVQASSSNAVQLSQAKEPSPAISDCAYHRDHFTTYYGGCGRWINWSCTLSNHHSMNPPQYASNGCGNSVQLYQYSNYTGRTLCIGPGSRTGFLSRAWRSFRVIVC